HHEVTNQATKEPERDIRAKSRCGTISHERGWLIRRACLMGVRISSRAAQSFHWMEPTATLAEIARILRPGGLFAAYDYDWPPAIQWELDRLAQEGSLRFVELVRERGLAHLHELDEFVEGLRAKHEKGKRKLRNLTYQRLSWQKSRMVKRG